VVEVAAAAVGAASAAPRRYVVALSRRPEAEVQLHAFELLGAPLQLEPTFTAKALSYTAVVTERAAEKQLVLSLGPTDMGQGVRVALESAHADPLEAQGSSSPPQLLAEELPATLAQLPYRRRNFTLGRIAQASGGLSMLVPTEEGRRQFRLPIAIRVEVWSASTTFAADRAAQRPGAPGRVYRLALTVPPGATPAPRPGPEREDDSTKKKGAFQREAVVPPLPAGAKTPSKGAGGEEPGAEKPRGSWASTLKGFLFPVVLTAILGLLLAFVVRDGPVLPKILKVRIFSDPDEVARGLAEDEVEAAFHRARGAE